ncbi:hypothetical protein PMAYCL1PPCAC_22249, partial [Pristionchus mayeri]
FNSMDNQQELPLKISQLNALTLSMNDEEIGLSASYLGDTELKMQTELVPYVKKLLCRQVPCRETRVLQITIERNEENLARVEKALGGYSIKRVTFYQVSMKLIPDIARILRGLKSGAVTIYQEGIDEAEMSSQFADVISSIRSSEEFKVDLVFRAYSQHTTLLMSLLSDRAHTLKVQIQTHDHSDNQFIEPLAKLLPTLVSQSTSNRLLSIDNRSVPLPAMIIDFQDLCRKLEASEARRRVTFHVDERPEELTTLKGVSFKVVAFKEIEETFVVHLDTTDTECDCFVCEIKEREEREEREAADL